MALERNGTLSSAGVQEAMADVEKSAAIKEAGEKEIDIFVERTDGNVHEIRGLRTREKEVKIPITIFPGDEEEAKVA